jgi:hypothetical protein
MSPIRALTLVSTLAFAGCVGPGGLDGTVILRNESGRPVKSAQVNVVVSDTRGQLQQAPIDPFDQIYHEGTIAPGGELIVKYRSRSEYNIDTLVTWSDGSTARNDYGYVSDSWVNPTHVITITSTQLLFDGVPPIDVQSEPEKNYGKYNDKKNWPSYDL